MAKEGSWEFGFIDDNQNQICIERCNVFGKDEIDEKADKLYAEFKL